MVVGAFKWVIIHSVLVMVSQLILLIGKPKNYLLLASTLIQYLQETKRVLPMCQEGRQCPVQQIMPSRRDSLQVQSYD